MVAALEAETEAGSPFLWRGGALALDLVNTEVVVRGKYGDLLPTPEAAAQWWAEVQRQHNIPALAGGQQAWTEARLERIKELRAALRRLFGGVAQSHSVDENRLHLLNAVLATGHHTLVATSDAISAVYTLDAPDGDPLLFAVALSAFALLTQSDVRRLHKCKNERCALFFSDGTKNATRQWCSLDCTNRARSIENYRRSKEATAQA